MIVISDTNILSSLAAGDALVALVTLYKQPRLIIPPAVLTELQAGLAAGKAHLQLVLAAVQLRQIEVLALSAEEERLTFTYPGKLGAGEREALALAQSRRALLLTNDGEALRYCLQRKLKAVGLNNLLRSFWTANVLSPAEVRALIARMEQVEGLRLKPAQLAKIFAPGAS